MNRIRTGLIAACAMGLMGVSSYALAHHSAAGWVMDKRITISGTIKVAQFRNPHGHLDVTVTDAKGVSTDWGVETSAINLLMRRGWKPGKVKTGDKVTIVGHPSKTLPNQLYMREMTLADGTFFGDPEGKDKQLD